MEVKVEHHVSHLNSKFNFKIQSQRHLQVQAVIQTHSWMNQEISQEGLQQGTSAPSRRVSNSSQSARLQIKQVGLQAQEAVKHKKATLRNWSQLFHSADQLLVTGSNLS